MGECSQAWLGKTACTDSGHCNTSALAGSTTLTAKGVYLNLT